MMETLPFKIDKWNWKYLWNLFIMCLRTAIDLFVTKHVSKSADAVDFHYFCSNN